MSKELASLKKELTELAGIVNSFKSEAVQLKIVDLIFQELSTPQRGEISDSGQPRRKPKRSVSEKQKTKTVNKIPQAKKPSRGRPGPAAILKRLLDEGFFKKKRTIGDIISHCGSKLAYYYKPNELSGPLARFARDVKLDREKNADGQFEYIQK